MRSHYSTCIKPPPNPSKRGKNGSEMMTKNQTDQINGERRNQPTHLGATRKRSSKITVKPWLVFPRLRSISTRPIRYPIDAVDVIATIH
jgi:hypothetical protein